MERTSSSWHAAITDWLVLLEVRGLGCGVLGPSLGCWVHSSSLSLTGMSSMMLMGAGSSASGGGGGFVGALDDYASSLADVWSVTRRLVSSYTGPLLRVRETGGNIETDIGYIPEDGTLDVAALLSFCGSNSGFVTKVYSQLGGVSDAVQSIAGRQFQIVNAGALRTGSDSRPIMHWNSNTSCALPLTFSQGAGSPFTAGTVWADKGDGESTAFTSIGFGYNIECRSDGVDRRLLIFPEVSTFGSVVGARINTAWRCDAATQELYLSGVLDISLAAGAPALSNPIFGNAADGFVTAAGGLQEMWLSLSALTAGDIANIQSALV